MIVKQITKFDGKRADEFLEWDSMLCASLSVYNKTIFNVLQWKERPSELDANQETTRATWDAANQDLYSVLFSTTAGSLFSMFGGFRAKHRLREQETNNRRGQLLARNSTGVRRVFAGGHSGGAHQNGKHADAPRPRLRRVFVPHG